MKWNPFAKREAQSAPPAEVESEHAVTREAHAMLAQQSLQADTRPLQRAILRGEFILPLHEPPQEIGGKTRLRYLTFRDEAMLAVFTTIERARAFLQTFPELGAGVSVTYIGGQEACRMAAEGSFQTLGLDVGSPFAYEMQPGVFRTLASGRVLAAFPSQPLRGVSQPDGDIEIGAAPFSLAPPARADFAKILQSFSATRAFFYGATDLQSAPPELWISVALEGVSPDAMPELSRQMLAAWIEHWPFNTPLRLTRLDPDRDDAEPRADKLIAELGEPIL